LRNFGVLKFKSRAAPSLSPAVWDGARSWLIRRLNLRFFAYFEKMKPMDAFKSDENRRVERIASERPESAVMDGWEV
jgi:hypothetical protein